MATEFNPGGPVKRDGAAMVSINPPVTPAPGRSGWGTIGILVAIVAVVVFGLFISLRDRSAIGADDTGGATTGSSTAPAPSR
jgi:hypothetical protein